MTIIITHSTNQTPQTDPNAPPSRQAWDANHTIGGLPNDATKYLDGTGNFSTPAGIGGAAGGDLTGTYPNPTIAAGAVTEAKMTLANNTTGNVSISAHGFAPILPNDATKFLNGVGSFTVPSGGGGGGTPGGSSGQVQYNNAGAFGGLANGQIPATATNDNANAGNVGEYIAASSNCVPGSVTISIASPAVITWSSHSFLVDSTHNTTVPVIFTTTGALPTGITANTVYWVIGSSVTSTTFQIATSVANALAGTAINTSGSQSGTQTCNPVASLVSNTVGITAALSLPAGDWRVRGENIMAPAASTTMSYIASAMSTTGVLATNPHGGYILYPFAIPAGLPGASLPAGEERYSFSSTTTVYLITQVGFAVSTLNAGGFIGAERRR